MKGQRPDMDIVLQLAIDDKNHSGSYFGNIKAQLLELCWRINQQNLVIGERHEERNVIKITDKE